MLKNYFDTWAILAPDETQTASYNITCIQYWIEARGWGWDVGCYFGNRNISSGAIIWTAPDKKIEIDGALKLSPLESLLIAYLTALAAQRSITPGQWQHFKGGAVDVFGSAFWSVALFRDENYVSGSLDAEIIGEFIIEENPEISVNLYRKNQNMFYISKNVCDCKDRVFYSRDGKQWARKIECFLGLVSSELPEHEGKLRFVEVK